MFWYTYSPVAKSPDGQKLYLADIGAYLYATPDPLSEYINWLPIYLFDSTLLSDPAFVLWNIKTNRLVIDAGNGDASLMDADDFFPDDAPATLNTVVVRTTDKPPEKYYAIRSWREAFNLNLTVRDWNAAHGYNVFFDTWRGGQDDEVWTQQFTKPPKPPSV